VAKDIASVNSEQLSTLEIGAGTLNHLSYEPNILEYDIIEPFNQLYEDSNLLNRVRKIYSDIVEIPFSTWINRPNIDVYLKGNADFPKNWNDGSYVLISCDNITSNHDVKDN
jgi:hypothetical protein